MPHARLYYGVENRMNHTVTSAQSRIQYARHLGKSDARTKTCDEKR
jgi:hypothetical protein